MNIVWFSWKDNSHPLAGGAETVSTELRHRLIADGHRVKLITSFYSNAQMKEVVEGVEIIRLGSRYTVYYKARHYYKKHLDEWTDLVIDEMNTVPFMAGQYSRKPSLLLYYQLARKVWFYQMIFPLSLIGYLIEPLYLRIVSHIYRNAATESLSSKHDIVRYGFDEDGVGVFRVGTHLDPLKKLGSKDRDTVLILGAIRPMKRTLHAIKAFEIARQQNPELKLIVAGDDSGAYAQKVKKYIKESPHASSISLLGRVSPSTRLELMKTAAVILVTSIKEGWGLIVTEANSQGTPAVTYSVDGLRDSVIDGVTGYLIPSGDFTSMGNKIVALLGSSRYETVRKAGWENSKQYNFANSYQDFKQILKNSKLL